MPDDDLTRRGTAIVTGASAGIGVAFARRLAELGNDLVLVARREQRIAALSDELAAAHGVHVEPLTADLGDPAGLARVVQRAAGDDIAMLVNNAGINGYAPFAEIDPEVAARVIALNVTAPALLTRAAIPGKLARGRGDVVNIASILSFAGSLPPDPLPARATYAATKSFVVTFTRTLAAELAGTPLRIQVVCPGYTKTEFHRRPGRRRRDAPRSREAPRRRRGSRPSRRRR